MILTSSKKGRWIRNYSATRDLWIIFSFYKTVQVSYTMPYNVIRCFASRLSTFSPFSKRADNFWKTHFSQICCSCLSARNESVLSVCVGSCVCMRACVQVFKNITSNEKLWFFRMANCMQKYCKYTTKGYSERHFWKENNIDPNQMNK